MKARIQTRIAPTALLYNLENKRSYDVAQICSEAGVQPVRLDTMSAVYSVGYLCCYKGFSGDIMNCEIPQSEALVFSGVDNQTMNTILERLRESKNTVDLKCVVTDTNKAWALGALVAELEKEHKIMHGVQS